MTRAPVHLRTSLLQAKLWRFAGISAMSAMLALACSSKKDGQSEGDDSAGSGADGASAVNASAVNGVSAVSTNGAQLSSATDGAGSTTAGTSGSSDFEECVGTVSEGEVLALDMYVVLDHTSSMTQNEDDCPLVVGGTPGSNNKWCYATHALASFFVNNSAPGSRAALNFMAMPGYICEGGPDNPQARPQVDFTLLPSDPDGPLITALSNDGPFGAGGDGPSTAIEAALRGINDFTVAARTPGRKMIGVLITDGDPTVCNTDVDFLASLVADQYDANAIETYFIGMTGATEANLESMAVQGGAPEHSTYCGALSSCHFWSVGDGDPAAFVDALNQIQAAALLPCSYQIPAAPPGEVIDFGLVNVEFTAANGETIGMTRVDESVGCVPGAYQWYYDNANAPSSIELCPDACEIATAQGQGSSIKLAYGCATDVDIE